MVPEFDVTVYLVLDDAFTAEQAGVRIDRRTIDAQGVGLAIGRALPLRSVINLLRPLPLKPDIVSFWHGSNKLGPLARLCLASQVKTGHRVTVFSYAPLQGLPPHVENEDAEAILPIATMDRLQYIRARHGAARRLLQFSDLFRFRLQRLGRGLWLDMDIYLLRTLDIDPDAPYWAWESNFIANCVCYIPKTHLILADYERLYDTPDLSPDWLTLRIRARRMLWSLLRKKHTPGDLNLLIYGPMALTQLARRHGSLASVMPRKSFNAYGMQFYAANHPHLAQIVRDPNVLGIHVRTHHFASQSPKPGSLNEWAHRRVVGLYQP